MKRLRTCGYLSEEPLVCIYVMLSYMATLYLSMQGPRPAFLLSEIDNFAFVQHSSCLLSAFGRLNLELHILSQNTHTHIYTKPKPILQAYSKIKQDKITTIVIIIITIKRLDVLNALLASGSMVMYVYARVLLSNFAHEALERAW